MPQPLPPIADRPVLLWRPDSDETQVQASVERAAQFLGLSADEVVAAIQNGELLGGWFADWEAARPG